MRAPDLGTPLRGRRVLIVEDHWLVAEELRRAVRQLGGDVAGPVPDLAAALDILRTEAVDLALLDINLEGGDAYPAARELSRRKIPFAFATGCEPWVVPPEFGDTLRLEKPVTTRVLSDAVQRLAQPRR